MKRLLAILVIALGVWFYFTPHIAVRGMQEAAQARDAARLSSFVDFPALRENLKATLEARLQDELKARTPAAGLNDLASALGKAMLTTIMNPLIDAIITPEGIARVIAGEQLMKPSAAQQPQSAAPGAPPAASTPPSAAAPSAAPARTEDSELSMGYETFDRFVATAKRKDGYEEPAALVFTRHGWFSWKLTGIRLPK